MTRAIIETAKGNINIQFFDADAPNTVKNFVDLAEKGFYDGIRSISIKELNVDVSFGGFDDCTSHSSMEFND